MSTPTTASEAESQRLPARGLILLVGLTLVWGLNWPVMKIVLAEVPVWWFRGIAVPASGISLLLLTALSGARVLPHRNEIGALLFCALFAVVGWHLCTAYGISLMPAGRATIIAYTMPLWAALFGSLLIGERMTWTKLIGQACGFAGLMTLIGSDLVVLQKAPLGALFMLAAAMCWGMGTVLFKRTIWSVPVSAAIGWQLLAGAVPIALGALLVEVPFQPAQFKVVTWAAFAYVILLPMTFGQWAFFSMVKQLPASVAAMSTLAVPVISVYLSTLLLGETVALRDIIALGLICAALFAVLVVPALHVGR
jgi:drug/metabolite transporter (DMT)-like permease